MQNKICMFRFKYDTEKKKNYYDFRIGNEIKLKIKKKNNVSKSVAYKVKSIIFIRI